MIDPTLPDLSRDTLVELAGWAVLKEARGLVEGGLVHALEWEAPELRAEVGSGAARFFPRVDLRSLTFAENRCNCPTGRRRQMCAHAIAACLAAWEGEPSTVSAKEPEATTAAPPGAEGPATAPAPTLTSLHEDPEGAPLRLRFLLPPNLAAAAPRDAIMIKLEVAIGRELTTPEKLSRRPAYHLDPKHRRAYLLLEQWCGGKPGTLLQLKRTQLRAVLEALQDEPVFAWVRAPDRPLEWQDGALPEVHPHLAAVPAEAALAPVAPTPAPETRASPPPPRPAPIAVPRRGAPRRPLPPARPSAVEAMKDRLGREGRPGDRVLVDGSTQFLAVQLPDRDHLLYEPAVSLLKAHEFRLEHSNGKWWLRDRHKTLNFLAAHEGVLRDELGAHFTDNYRQRTAGLKRVEIRSEVAKNGRDYDLALTLEAPGVEPNALYRALATGCHYVIEGEAIFLFEPERLKQYRAAQEALAGERGRALTPRFQTRLRPAQLRDAEQILGELDEDFAPPVDWKRRSGALGRLDQMQPAPLDDTLQHTLRTYQQIGTAWLWHLYRHELGGILADEMGLGKTIQALGLLQCARREGAAAGPSLVVCPASLLGNWAREAGRFTPGLRVFTHHRESRLADAADADAFDLILTSYPTLVRDTELFLGVDWNVILADEAQHIKNRRTQAAKALRSLPAHARFILTGTPIENSLDDLRALFAFLLPGYLAKMPPGASGEERSWFDDRHRAQAAPYILRRTKQLVAPELPEKIEQVVYCDLTPRQRKLYAETQVKTERALADLELAGRSEAQVRIAALAQLLRLRQVCAEPRLLKESLRPEDSTKLEAFREILDEALDGGHRMLVFSQFVSVLTHLRAFLENRDLPYAYLDGKTRDRLAECDRFNEDPSIPVFLISLKAGGTGLNLTGADTVVHFDPWWNPAVEDQASDRAHRLGQTRTVTVYKLITAGTVEEKVLALQTEKSALLRGLLDDSAAATAKVGLAELRDLLRA